MIATYTTASAALMWQSSMKSNIFSISFFLLKGCGGTDTGQVPQPQIKTNFKKQSLL